MNLFDLSPSDAGLIAAVALIAGGLYGLLILRNLVKLIVALQLASKGVIIALILAGNASGSLMLAQSLAATFILIDTLVAVIGLALAVQLHRSYDTLDVKMLRDRSSARPDSASRV
jgi:NADH-quinone oxidoreductase subunit K